MSIIKPGRLGFAEKPNRVAERRTINDLQNVEIWDDFDPAAKKKKVYEKGAGNRMFPRSDEREAFDREANNNSFEGQSYTPRIDYDVLEGVLGISFQDKSLLSRALTHRSAVGMKERADYERLEFLGDAVLDLSVAHLLSDRHPDAREGELSKMRAALVNTQALAKIAKNLDINPFIRLGRGELSSGGAERPSILADVTEAIIGAYYRDRGYDAAFKLIENLFGKDIDQVTPFDPKTELQEQLHTSGSEPPTYLLEMVEGPEHAPTFVTIVQVDGQIAGRGRAGTKKSAQQIAATEALAKMVPSVPAQALKDGQNVFILQAMLFETEMSKKYIEALLEQTVNE